MIVKLCINKFGKVWYLRNNFHRTDGPAIVYNTRNQYWFRYGKRIR